MFVNNISGIGGAELYILRKAKYLINQGYDVIIISGIVEPILISEFKNLNAFEFNQILFPTNILKRGDVEKTLVLINELAQIKNDDKLLVESHQTAPALWAEAFALNNNCSNLVYPLVEISLKRKIYKQFFFDKLNNNLLLGCNKSYIKNVFNVDKPNNYINIPFSADEIETTSCNIEKQYDIGLLTLSRVNKNYIIESIRQINRVALANQNLVFNYDIYLDKRKGRNYKKIIREIGKIDADNLLINTRGPVNPLNTSVFSNQDIFIGMGTSLLNACSMGLPSLVIDYRNNNCYGFFGLDHFEFGASEKRADRNLSYFIKEYLNNIQMKGLLGKQALEYFQNNYEAQNINNQFLKYFSDINNSIPPPTYVNSELMDLRDYFDYWLVKIVGIKKALKIRALIIRILGSFLQVR